MALVVIISEGVCASIELPSEVSFTMGYNDFALPGSKIEKQGTSLTNLALG